MGLGPPFETTTQRTPQPPVPAVDTHGDDDGGSPPGFPGDDRRGGARDAVGDGVGAAAVGGDRASPCPIARVGRRRCCSRWKCSPAVRKHGGVDGDGLGSPRVLLADVAPVGDVVVVVHHGDLLGRAHHPSDDSIRSSGATLLEAFASGST